MLFFFRVYCKEVNTVKQFLLVLAAPVLVSCTHFSGKLDTMGRRDAVMDASAVVSERYRVGGKSYVPVDGALSFILLGLFHDDDDSEQTELLRPASPTSS